MTTSLTMWDESAYIEYLNNLLSGNRAFCASFVEKALSDGIAVETLYEDLFRRSLYDVGKLWERNKISVAKEHLATSITESLLLIPEKHIFKKEKKKSKAIISCTANEYHQVGGRIVADYLEMEAINTLFLGANSPMKDLMELIQTTKPAFIGLSLTVYFNISNLIKIIEEIQNNFKNLDIIVGGQAFQWGLPPAIKNNDNVTYIDSLHKLKLYAATFD